MSILETIGSPKDLKSLNIGQLYELAGEIRQAIVDAVSKNGGHLASNLGLVEFTIALLYVFDPPDDKILFDVSHQAYTYKLLTGRRDSFGSLRKLDGISGFMNRSESKYDVFGAGHAGTSISAGLGFAVERDLRKGNESIIAVIGDASISNGNSFEALNNVTSITKNMIIALNDNRMSISKNVGALSKAFGRLISNPKYNKWKSAAEDVGIRKLKLSRFRKIYHRIEQLIKSLFVENTIFEGMGIRYIGSVDGHDIKRLIGVFKSAKAAKCPVVVHFATKKGLGYKPAEEDPARWHACSPFNIESAESKSSNSTNTWSDVFGHALIKLAASDKRIAAITAGMADGTGLVEYSKKYPDRFFDVGICEDCQMTFAAGIAAAGLRPVAAVYSTFAQRAIDEIVHDIALQKLPVVICLDRAGVVPSDGATHHGILDIAMLRCVPNLVIMQPRVYTDLEAMLKTALAVSGPVAIRYPRGARENCEIAFDDNNNEDVISIGHAAILTSPDGQTAPQVALWSLGVMDEFSLSVAELLKQSGIDSVRVDARFVKPLDVDLLFKQVSDGIKIFVTIEDGVAAGGFGSAVNEALSSRGLDSVKIISVGWPDCFIPHASNAEELMRKFDITPEFTVEKIKNMINI